MDFVKKIEKFGLFLESVKDINPVLVESIATGFTAIVEAGVPSHWSDEAYDEEMSNELDEQPLAENKPSIELAPYVFAEVIDEDGKITIWKKGFGDLAVSNDYDSKDFDELVSEAKVNYTRMKTTGKYNKELVDDPKEVIEMNLTESEDSDNFINITYEVGSVTDKQPNGDGGQFVKVFPKYGDKKYLIMTDSKRNGPWKVMVGMNNGKIIATKPTMDSALEYVNYISGDFDDVTKFETLESLIEFFSDAVDTRAKSGMDLDESVDEIIEQVKKSLFDSGFNIPLGKVMAVVLGVDPEV